MKVQLHLIAQSAFNRDRSGLIHFHVCHEMGQWSEYASLVMKQYFFRTVNFIKESKFFVMFLISFAFVALF